MANPKSSPSRATKKTARVTKKMYDDLRAENDSLRKKIEGLAKVNKGQLGRLVGEELLKIHTEELKAKLALLEKPPSEEE